MTKKIETYLNKIICDDCLEVMKEIPDGSIDAIITDPPYGLSFMGKNWDKAVPPVNVWKESMRILKDGAFAFIMCIPRQDCLSHMIINLEEAGFDIGFTSIYWTYACLSEDTKILTKNGLRGIDELSENDTVFSFDINRNTLVKTKIDKKWIYNYDGKLFNLKNQNTDQLITPNHKILLKNKYHSGKKIRWDENWKYIEANNIKLHCAIKIPISGKYEGYNSIGTELASLLGWILSEGSLVERNREKDVRIYQSSTNINNVNEIRNILSKLRIKYKEYQRTRIYKNREYDEYCFYFSGNWYQYIKALIPNKKPTKDLLNLIYEERLALYNALIKGDGSRRSQKKRGKENKYYTPSDTFYQKDGMFLDWFEMLVLGLGWQPKRNRNKNAISIKKQADTEFQWNNFKPKLINYKGRIWCITTNYSNFVAWRNDRYFITGNSGFPKAQNISKTIDKQACKKELTEKLGRKPTKKEFGEAWKEFRDVIGVDKIKGNIGYEKEGYNYKPTERYITIPKTHEARALDGSYAGFQPKPAVEVVIVAMKPLSKKTYVAQALKNEKGITWLNDGRIPFVSEDDRIKNTVRENRSFDYEGSLENGERMHDSNLQDRFPANLLVEDDVLNDGKITKSVGGNESTELSNTDGKVYGWVTYDKMHKTGRHYADSDSFSRYFDLDAWFEERIKQLPKEMQKTFPFLLVPKASKSEKSKGLDNIKSKYLDSSRKVGSIGGCNPRNRGAEKPQKNHHPTVKPIKLMSYLITVGSREGDIILDPFAGSGSTLLSANILNRNFIGIDISKEYCNIANARLKVLPESLSRWV